MLRDLTYAARSLRSSPAFTSTTVITLALGIAASTAIFSVANAVLLRPLLYKDPERLVYACADMLKRNVYDFLWSNADYFDLRNNASSALEDVAAVRTGRTNLPHDDGTPEQIAYATVTPNIFHMLGARIALGRDFVESDGLPEPRTADGFPPSPTQRLPTYAIVSYEFFQRRLGGNQAVLGKPIMKNGPILVGVLAPGFELLFPPDKNVERTPDMWTVARLSYGEPRTTVRLRLIGRLREGVTLRRAQAEADAVAEQCRAAEPVWRTAGFQIRLEPMQRYLVSQVRPAILALMGAVIFLLLIACSNVANLFLVRASLRSRDLGVRSAVGASWWDLARQVFAEALLVATVGSAAGFGLAGAGIRQLVAIAPANLPRLDAIRIDAAVFAFSFGAGLATAVIFGLMPSIHAARPDVMQLLRASQRGSGLSGRELPRNAVVVAEVALCFVLLVASGLMFRSFLALQRINPGFDSHRVLTFRTPGGNPGRTAEERAATVRQMRDTLAAIPGVQSVTAANLLPLDDSFFPYRWGLEDALVDPSKFQAADTQTVLPGYFTTMRTPLVAGRAFDESDNNPSTRHVIVDEALVAKAFPTGHAVGQRILMRFRTPEPEWFEIIGVAAHQHLTSLVAPGREQAYLPDGYWGHGMVSAWALRTNGDAGKYTTQVRAEMAKFNSRMLVTDMQTMDSIVEREQSGTRFSLMLIAAFAIIATALATVGLYGVLSTVVRQRTPEIGVRMALGAAPTGILGLMVGYGLRLSTAGVLVGLIAAVMLTRVMTSILVGVRPTDPITFVVMAALFFFVAAVATWMPARRAAALDPSAALREE
jgi:predicted permease